MENFLTPTSVKLKILIVLTVYIMVSSLFMGALSSGRSFGPRSESLTTKAVLVFSYPGAMLAIPGLYVSDHLFTTKTSLTQMMVKSGCINCTEERDDQTVSSPSIWGFLAGLAVELFILYILVCWLSFPFQQFFSKK